MASMILALLAPGCGAQDDGKGGDEEQVGTTEQALDDTNGTGLNGVALNGTGLNGTGLNGTGLNGVALNGTGLNGTGLNGTGLNGTGLNGTGLNGTGLNGTGLNGTGLNGTGLNGTGLNGTGVNGLIFTGLLSNGGTIPIRVDSTSQGSGSNSDVFMYGVSYQNTDGWQPLCGREPDGSPVLAIPLAGRWDMSQGTATGGSHIDDPGVVTFACMHKALAKCVVWGYKPWKSVNGVSLADYHQACTRMVRADYCGDGVSWTRNGQPIDMYDGLGVQTDTEPAWMFEAEFRPDGAACVSHERIKEMQTTDGGNPKQCIQDRDKGLCGAPDHFGSGTLLMVRHPKPNDVAP